MTTTEILVSNIAVSASLVTCLGFLLKSWIETRLSQSVKHEYDRRLAEFQSELQATNQQKLETFKAELSRNSTLEIETFKVKLQAEYKIAESKNLRYYEKQFPLYNDLWISLADLEASVQKLWQAATSENLNIFSEQIVDTRIKIKKAALLIENRHYVELNYILDQFEAFRFGKKMLLQLRSRDNIDAIGELEIGLTIQDNEEKKEDLLIMVTQMMQCLKQQIHHPADNPDDLPPIWQR